MVAVVDFPQATVLHENEIAGARPTDSGSRILTVRNTSRDMSDKSACNTVSEEISLRAANASAKEVNGLAEILTTLDASSRRKIIKVAGVAFGAVKVADVPKAAEGVGGLRGYQRKAEADREGYESFLVHVVCWAAAR
jgi:hypothetical protein